MGEEVRNGEIAGGFKAVNDEFGGGDEFSLGEIGRNRGKRGVLGEESEGMGD